MFHVRPPTLARAARNPCIVEEMIYHTTLMTITLLYGSIMVGQVLGEPLGQEQVGVMVEQVGVMVEQVGVMVGQVVEHHLPGCHLVIITTTRHSHVTSTILRRLNAGGVAAVVVEAGLVVSQDHLARDHLARDHLLQHLWGDATTTCRGLILDLTSKSINNTNNILWLAEEARLWKLPETVVVAVGERAGVREVLLHHSLRNTLHALYLVFGDGICHNQ
nr:uncharacterized protein LOC123759263 [Procambarus clarkii]